MGRRKSAKSKKASSTSRFTAATADKHELYELSVQSPESDIEFLEETFREERGREALHFREDFCGTAYLSATWIARGADYTAEGFDIDRPTLDNGIERHFKPLGADADRCTLHEKDVREKSDTPPDVRCAQNFSYCIFKTRAELKEYLQACYDDLADDGIFVLDAHGGQEVFENMEEETEQDEGFTYIWDQDEFWPVTHEAVNYIHFEFEDGTKMRRAFTYEWRIWTLPELIEVLYEVGFAHVDAYWEGTDEDGESGDGVFTKTKLGENDVSWVSYLSALK